MTSNSERTGVQRSVVSTLLSAGWELALNLWDLSLGRKFSDYVYVNQDGTARELASDEKEYLAEQFHPGDGARPYIKGTYNARDGWGSLSGFILRRRLPSSVTVKPVNPNYKTPACDPIEYELGESYETIRRKMLEAQRAREKAAELHDP